MPHAPCIFTGTIIPNEPPIYLGLYVDDIIYFSTSSLVEQTFEKKFSSKITTNFHGNVTYYLGIKVTPIQYKDGHLSIYLNQPAFIENLLIDTKLNGPGVNTAQTP